MKRGKWILGVLFLTGAIAPLLRAQTFALPFSLSQSSPALTFGIDSNGTFTETGPLNSSVTFTFSSNPEMVWFPAQGAFRAGLFFGPSSSQPIGPYSVAFGSGSSASGSGSLAAGLNNIASGTGSLADGVGSNASGLGSTAIGYYATAFGSYSTVLGNGFASGVSALVLGSGSAFGSYSTSMGSGQALGTYAVAAGQGVSNRSVNSMAIGTYNVGFQENSTTLPNTTTSSPTDPAFEVGNGTRLAASPYTITTSDALVVYKNGDAAFPAATSTVTAATFVTTQASGDIPMYTGN